MRCGRSSRLDFRAFAGTSRPRHAGALRLPPPDARFIPQPENVRSHRIQESGTAGPLEAAIDIWPQYRIPIPGNSFQCRNECQAESRSHPRRHCVANLLGFGPAAAADFWHVRPIEPGCDFRQSDARKGTLLVSQPVCDDAVREGEVEWLSRYLSEDRIFDARLLLCRSKAKPPHRLRHPHPARKVGFRRLNLASTSRAEGSQHDVEDRRKEQAEERHAEHPRKNGRSE